MKNTDLSKIRKAMEKAQDSKRYEHTLGVAYTAAALAMHYGTDINNTLIAGFLHDCAKQMSDDKKLHFCEKHNISVTDAELKNPSLLHAKVGSFIAMETYKVDDVDIINAILNHTTGRPEMSDLEKIIFIADYIEPLRTKAPNLEEIRALAFSDLDRAVYLTLRDTLSYLEQEKACLDNQTVVAYNYYKNLMEQKEA